MALTVWSTRPATRSALSLDARGDLLIGRVEDAPEFAGAAGDGVDRLIDASGDEIGALLDAGGDLAIDRLEDVGEIDRHGRRWCRPFR